MLSVFFINYSQYGIKIVSLYVYVKPVYYFLEPIKWRLSKKGAPDKLIQTNTNSILKLVSYKTTSKLINIC
jgi:hypothetical protein